MNVQPSNRQSGLSAFSLAISSEEAPTIIKRHLKVKQEAQLAGRVELPYNPSRPQRDANKCAEAFRTAPDQSESATRKGFGRLSDTYRPQ